MYTVGSAGDNQLKLSNSLTRAAICMAAQWLWQSAGKAIQFECAIH